VKEIEVSFEGAWMHDVCLALLVANDEGEIFEHLTLLRLFTEDESFLT
jgi:hypothetical protein